MQTVNSQTQLRWVRDLKFCHVCSLRFSGSAVTNYDHVPPKSCFDKADRNPPLKLKTHVKCNNENKVNDEKVGQLIAVRRHQSLNPSDTLLDFKIIDDGKTGTKLVALTNLDVHGAIRRWIGGFHTALYREPLLPNTNFSVSTPLPSAKNTAQGVVIEPIRPEHTEFVKTIKLNRAAGNVDTIVTNSGKLRYQCVWARDDTMASWFCIFALDLYDWITLGDINNFQARGCVGAYMLNDGLAPQGACLATSHVIDLNDSSKFDPFA